MNLIFIFGLTSKPCPAGFAKLNLRISLSFLFICSDFIIEYPCTKRSRSLINVKSIPFGLAPFTVEPVKMFALDFA